MGTSEKDIEATQTYVQPVDTPPNEKVQAGDDEFGESNRLTHFPRHCAFPFCRPPSPSPHLKSLSNCRRSAFTPPERVDMPSC